MGLSRALLALGATVMASACGSAPSAPSHLSMDEQAAYLVLRDQLEQLPGKVTAGRSVYLCVVVSSQGTGERLVDDRFLAALRHDMPAQLDAKLLSASTCLPYGGVEPYAFPDGKPAWELSAYLKPGNPDLWTGSVVCGGLCGWGNTYRVEVHFGRLSVTRLSYIFS